MRFNPLTGKFELPPPKIKAVGFGRGAGSRLALTSYGIGNKLVGGTPGSILYVDANGNVGQDPTNFFYDYVNIRQGIGTATPTSALSIVKSAPSASDGWDVTLYSNTATIRPQNAFRRARGTVGTPLIVQNADVVGGLSFQTYDGVGFYSGATIRADISGAVVNGGGSQITDLIFFTTSVAGSEAENARLINNGVWNVTTGYRIGNVAVSGNYLRGDGTNFISSAIQLADVPAHNLLSATHGDTTAASVVRGDIIIGSGVAPKWTRLAIGASGTVLHGGTEPAYSAVSLTADVTGTLPIANGGTANITALAAFNALSPLTTRGDIITRDATDNIRLAIGANKTYLRSDGTDTGWSALLAGDLPANGANPTASVGLSAVNGTATTWMRSDAAPALSVAITPVWTGAHEWNQAGIAVTYTDAATIENKTASTAGVPVQQSASQVFLAHVWSTGINSDLTSRFRITDVPTSQTTPIGTLLWDAAVTVGAGAPTYTNRMALTSDGVLSVSAGLNPIASDGAALGTTALMWSDLFLASGAVINFNNGNVTLTHASALLTVAGGGIVLAAGTTTLGPLKFTSGTNLTTPAAGTIEYDGKVFYGDHAASARGAVPTEMFAIIASGADFTLGANANAQAYFTGANDALTVIANTLYFFETTIYLTTGSTSHNTGFLFGGSATFTDVMYWGMGGQVAIDTASTPTTGMNLTKTQGTAMVLGATGTGTVTYMHVRGHFRIANAGTIIPQIKFSANPTGTNLAKAGTYFRCWPAGTDTVASLGNWG